MKEYYLFANNSNRTYIGESGQPDKGVLSFSLPEGAAELQATMGRMDLALLIDSNRVEVTSDQLADDEPMSIDGRQYQHLSGKDLAKGEDLVIHLSALSRSGSSGSFLWTLLAVGVIAVGSVSIYLVRSKGRKATHDEGKSDREQRLLAEIAALDNDFEAGEIPEETYCKLRAEKKAELTSIIQARQEE